MLERPERFTNLVMSRDGRDFVVGDFTGRVHLLSIDQLEAGPTILTAWRSAPSDAFRRLLSAFGIGRGSAPSHYGCPHCHIWSPAADGVLGHHIACANCAAPLRLNAFTIAADWR